MTGQVDKNMSDVLDELARATKEIEWLKREVSRLESRLVVHRLPNTRLLSDSLITRAMTVYGHFLLASFVIAIPLWCLSFLLGALIGN